MKKLRRITHQANHWEGERLDLWGIYRTGWMGLFFPRNITRGHRILHGKCGAKNIDL